MLFQRVEMFIDFALTYALLNFIGSIAAARFFNRVNPTKSFADLKAEDSGE
jgi:multisubunit Na+/H+ antiporter MnhF subunit